MTSLSPHSAVGAARRRSAWHALTLCLWLFALGCADHPSEPIVRDGVADLSQWDFTQHGPVTLNGDWQVCWGRLLEPDETECRGTGWQTVRVPGLWSEPASAAPFGGRGVATYRLRIELPDDARRLSLHAGAPTAASRLWIDGVDRGGSGVVGPTAEASSTAPRRNRNHEFTAAGAVELRVQIVNHDFRGGGIKRPWVIGPPDAIQILNGRMLLREVLLFAVGVLVGLGYLVQFAIRPEERARGYFGMVTLVLGLRAIPASISNLQALTLPFATLELIVRLEYLGLALVVFSGAGYFLLKVPNVMPPRTIRAVQAIALALVPITLIAPYSVVQETLVFYFVLPPLVIALVIVSYGRAWIRGVPGVASTVIASLLYLVVIAHDLLRTYEAGLGLSVELFPYFIVIWILNEAAEGMQVFNRTFARVESISGELAEANFELQETESAVTRFVPFDLLRLLGRTSIHEVTAGDHTEAEMTVLCFEHHELTRLVDARSTEQAFTSLNEVVARLEPLIYHRDGFVCQYDGLDLIALFPRAAQDALEAAFAIVASIGAGGAEAASSQKNATRFDVGIGIATGPVLVGTIGGDQHFTSSVIGDAVLTARRIEALTHSSGESIVITAHTRASLTDSSGYDFRSLGHVTVREDAPDDAGVVEVLGVSLRRAD